MLSAKEFARVIGDILYIYRLILLPVGDTNSVRSIGAIGIGDKEHLIQVLDKYQEFAYIFLIEAASILPDYNDIEYRIILEDGTRPL